MTSKSRTAPPLRTVQAPPPENPRTPPAVISVQLGEDEAVEWIWSEGPEGRRVTGYRITPIPRRSR